MIPFSNSTTTGLLPRGSRPTSTHPREAFHNITNKIVGCMTLSLFTVAMGVIGFDSAGRAWVPRTAIRRWFTPDRRLGALTSACPESPSGDLVPPVTPVITRLKMKGGKGFLWTFSNSFLDFPWVESAQPWPPPLFVLITQPIVVLVRSTNEPNLTIMLSPKQFDPLDLEIQLE